MRDHFRQIWAPWTHEQVKALNEFQRKGEFHPYTCGSGTHSTTLLLASPDGWWCPDCTYTQPWAWAFSAGHL